MTTTESAATTQPNHALVARAQDSGGSIAAFSSQSNFEAGQRMAKALASSSLVPEVYKGNVANVLIAMELASRIGASVFAVMQNIDIIHGRPSWRATFLIATVNACGRFSPIRFRFEGKPNTDAWGCRAVAKDRETGEECVGALITIGLAKSEGWASKTGSKWKTMPEQMLMYRAAAFWTRVYAPEQSLGMQTVEEAIDVHGYTVEESVTSKPVATSALESALLGKPPASEPSVEGERAEEEVDPITGEIVPPESEVA